MIKDRVFREGFNDFLRFATFYSKKMSNADSTRQKIVLAAGPIFAKKGFRAATVREICDSAQVNLASINYYFGDKQQLYIETVVQARQMRAQQVPFPKWEDGTLPERKLFDFVSLLLNRMVALKTAPWQVRLIMREILQPTKACRKLLEDYFSPLLEKMMSIIDEIVACRMPQHRRMQLAFSIIGQCMYYRFAGDVASMMIDDCQAEESFRVEELARHITDFSLAALRNIHCEPDQSPGKPTRSGSSKSAELE